MRILLDENFPTQLYRRLQEAGHVAEHIALGLRGLPDDAIRLRLATEADLVFLTHDTEFAELPPGTLATVHDLPSAPGDPDRPASRVVVANNRRLLRQPISGRLFEVQGDGQVVAWHIRDR